MISDYYYATLIECVDPGNDVPVTVEVTKNGVKSIEHIPFREAKFKKIGNSVFKYQFPYYIDVLTHEKYYAFRGAPMQLVVGGNKYIDTEAGIIPIRKFLRYSSVPFQERREIFKLLRAFDAEKHLKLKLERVNLQLQDMDKKIKRLGGLYEKNI